MTHESRPSSTIDSFFPPKNEPRGPKPSKPLFTSYEGAAHLFMHTAANGCQECSDEGPCLQLSYLYITSSSLRAGGAGA
jgi:hypothetical protein